MSDEYPSILYEVAQGVATLTLNRPDKLNAINTEMARRWADCLEQAQADEAVGAVLITGAGRGFCSGGDVERMGGDDAMTPLRIKERLRQGVQRIPLQLARMDKIDAFDHQVDDPMAFNRKQVIPHVVDPAQPHHHTGSASTSSGTWHKRPQPSPQVIDCLFFQIRKKINQLLVDIRIIYQTGIPFTLALLEQTGVCLSKLLE